MRVLVLHGPNLNRLGRREPEVYGTLTLVDVDDRIRVEAATLGLSTTHLQTNHEGVLIDAMHAADGTSEGILLNAGAWTHTSYALRDAIASIPVPCVEVHLTDLSAREEFRRVSVIEPVCVATFMGRGVDSYLDGLRWRASKGRVRS